MANENLNAFNSPFFTKELQELICKSLSPFGYIGSDAAHIITYNDAISRITEFVGLYENFASLYGSGMSISDSDLSAFKIPIPNDPYAIYSKGLLLVLGLDSNQRTIFHTAFREVIINLKTGYDQFNMATFPLNTGLTIKPSNYAYTFKYTGTNVKNWIESFNQRPIATSTPVSETIVNEHSLAFAGEFRNSLRLPVAFIHHNEVNAVLNQDNCIGLRIYLGYDNTLDPAIYNKLRLIIFGVNTEGYNITERRNEAGNLISGIILDKAWP